MKQIIHVVGVLCILLIAFIWVDFFNKDVHGIYSSLELTKQLKDDGILPRGKNLNSYNQRPSDWFYRQRAYPYDDIPREKQIMALREATAINKIKIRSGEIWEMVGPSNIPGRVTDIAVDTTLWEHLIIYVASAAGGVFKSEDNGANWIPIFDDVDVLPVGAIALDPQNPQTIYVGTGEANSGADTYEGNGIYKSIDGGSTWNFVGLPDSYHIGRIVVDPLRPDTIYAAVGGKHFGALNSERGLYRSDDGGATWVQKLYISDSTSCIDLALHPSTGTVFACMWEKVRFKGDHVRLGGITSGLYRSTDFGDNWSLVSGTGGYPPQAANISRIGITVDPLSNTVYSSIIDLNGYDLYGVYKSTDLGLTWTQTNDGMLDGMFGGFGWYFGQIRVAPGNPDLVYVLGVQLYISNNGGNSWYWDADGIHVDHHALALLPNASFPGEYYAYEGCDGGVNYRVKESDPWSNLANMPNTQFYAIHIDESNPYLSYYGGTQDNGSMRATDGDINNWQHILGGDGFYCLVDYTNSDIIYAEYQNGYLVKSTNNAAGWSYAMDGIDYNNDRHNWNTPIAMSPGDHNVLYYGSQYLYKTEDGAENWTPISGDLSSGPYPTYPSFGTITTIDIGHQNNDVIYVATDDGNIWVTQNGGTDWTSINTDIPNRWVTRVTVDPRDDAIVYAAISGYDWSEHMAHVYRSTNYGADWVSISGDLPDSPVHDVIPDPHADNTVWIGTDFGVYVTEDMGATWLPLGSGLPMAAVHDIDFNSNPSRILIAGTHGRSLYRTVVPCPDDHDTDEDGIMDACDNCPLTPNPSQNDPDHRGLGFDCEYELCGNINFPIDNEVNILDVVYLINYKYKKGSAPASLESADVNNDLQVNILDAVYIITFKYKSGPEPICPTGL